MADAFIGEIRIFAGNFAPVDWAFCDGSLIPIAQNTALFSILGTQYGGNGTTNFALPDLRGRAPMHQGNGAGLTPRTVGEETGSQTVTLDSTQIPSHTHQAMGVPGSSNPSINPQNLIWAKTPAIGHGGSSTPLYTSAAPNTTMHPYALSIAGGTQPHNNMQPYLAMNFIICLNGIFPPRS